MRKYWWILCSLLLAGVMAFALITKDPAIFPDEIEFGSIAGQLGSGEEKQELFDDQFAFVYKTDIVSHGPTYYWLLSGAYKIFGFGLIQTRIASIIVGLLGMIVGIKTLILLIDDRELKWILSLIVGVAIAVDYYWLRMIRFGRPEVLVLFFSLLASYGYLKYLKGNVKSLWLALMFGLLAMSTHWMMGGIVLVSIMGHLFFEKKWKELGIWVGLVVIFFVGIYWFVSEYWSVELQQAITLWRGRSAPTWRSIKAVMEGDLLVKTIFVGYLMGVVMMLKRGALKSIEKYLSIYCLINMGMVIWGSIDWYLGLLVWPSYILLARAITGLKEKDRMWGKMGMLVLLWGIVVGSVEQVLLISYGESLNYARDCTELSRVLPEGKRVWITSIVPDPSWCLYETRADLKIEGRIYELYDHGETRKQESLSRTEYLIVQPVYSEYLDYVEKIGEEKADELARISGLDMEVALNLRKRVFGEVIGGWKTNKKYPYLVYKLKEINE